MTPPHLCWVILSETEDCYQLEKGFYKTYAAAESVARSLTPVRPVAIMQLYEWIELQEGLRDLRPTHTFPNYAVAM